MHKFITVSAIVLCTTLATDLSAATFSFSSMSGIWQNSQPVSAAARGEGTSRLTWGILAQHWPSSLAYAAGPTPFSVADSTTFSLGRLTHRNSQIVGSPLTSADLLLSIDVAGFAQPIVTTLSIGHWETANAPPCPYVIEHFNGCADQVMGTWNAALSDTFKFGNKTYAIEFLGFAAQGEIFDDFWTAEGQVKEVDILASIQVVAQVPLPTGGLALLSALAVLPALRRRLHA